MSDESLYSLSSKGKIPPGGPSRKPKNNTGLFLSAAVVVGVVAFVFLVVKVLPSRGATGQDQARNNEIANDAKTGTERQLVEFAAQFLMNYYNYSAPIYEDAVKRAEAMMTQDFMTHYQAHALDRDFITTLQQDQVSTDGFRVTPGSYLFAHDGKRHWIQVSGTMTFTTGSNGARADWPYTVLMEVDETDAGFKVNNIKELR
jgi:hypothetical protein